MDRPRPFALSAAVRMTGATLIGVHVDARGMRIERAIRRAPQARRLRLPGACVPVGARLLLPRHIALRESATKSGGRSSNRLRGRATRRGAPATSLLGLDFERASDCVIRVGSFGRRGAPRAAGGARRLPTTGGKWRAVTVQIPDDRTVALSYENDLGAKNSRHTFLVRPHSRISYYVRLSVVGGAAGTRGGKRMRQTVTASDGVSISVSDVRIGTSFGAARARVDGLGSRVRRPDRSARDRWHPPHRARPARCWKLRPTREGLRPRAVRASISRRSPTTRRRSASPSWGAAWEVSLRSFSPPRAPSASRAECSSVPCLLRARRFRQR